MKKCYGVDVDKQRKLLLESEAAKPIIDEIIGLADSALDREYPVLKMSDYMTCYTTGNLGKFNQPYFQRKNDLSFVSIAYWFTDDEKYKQLLIDLIFMICDEFTWCLPEHVFMDTNPSTEKIVTQVDLFQSETARLLTDVIITLGDRLPYYVRQRIEYEIKRRIIAPLLTREDFAWQNGVKTNWAAVCAGGCLLAILEFGTEDEIKSILPGLYRAIDNYLLGFNDDGCCLEGYAYWNYGFGYFLIFAKAIFDYTSGKVNYFENEKVRNIALFPQKVRMSKNKIVSFSDGQSKYSLSLGATCLLKSIYKDDVILPKLDVPINYGNIFSMKEFLWFDTDYKADAERFETAFFDKSEWYIKKTPKFSFAAKGGHNDEPHNHNDIGSFMITVGDEIPLTDLGCAEYVNGTFDPDKRYTFLVNSSRGHSVPIINGKYQTEGEEYLAKNVKADDNSFSLDIEGAYEKGIINKIHREFNITESSVILTDTFDYSDKTESICERFVTLVEPMVCEGYIDLGTADLFFDKEKYSVSVSVDSYRSHGYDAKDVPTYLIDFEFIDKTETKFEIEIKIKEV